MQLIQKIIQVLQSFIIRSFLTHHVTCIVSLRKNAAAVLFETGCRISSNSCVTV